MSVTPSATGFVGLQLRSRTGGFPLAYKDPEKRRAYQRGYRAAHCEEARAQGRASYADHREKRQAHNAAYHAAHHDEMRALNAAYRASHREELRAKARAYAAAHREEAVARASAWLKAHPEKQREHTHRRRARIRSQFVAPVDAQAIYARDRGRCHICGKHVKRNAASMDHLKPISLGGVHAPWNVSLAHLKCNLKRNNRGVAQLRLMELL